MTTSANPAPLGLLGFGLTTMLLNLHNAGLYGLDTMILGMGAFVGGCAQILAGVLEFNKGNTFGLTAFTSYGAFWLSFVFLVLAPTFGLGTAPDDASLACYLGLWGLYTGFMFIGTFNKPRALQFIFGSLTLLFVLLAVSKATGNHALHTIAGYEGIICGFSALYLAMAEVINETYGRTILPIGAPRQTTVAATVAAEPAIA